jgi:hypothetical protein
MRIRNLVTILAGIGLGAGALIVPAGATSPNQTSLTANNWRAFNVNPSTSYFWDINKATSDGTGGISAPFSQFESTTTGSFLTYLETNYNVDLTGKTITVTASWTPPDGTPAYATRHGLSDGAYAYVEFQDVTSGSYTSNDYWWYNGNAFDLNSASSGSVTAALSDRAHWSNVCGQSATDMTPHPGPNCVGGTDPAVSPYDGFTNAMRNVKVVSLSFGRKSAFASGVAWNGPSATSASFDLASFDVTP